MSKARPLHDAIANTKLKLYRRLYDYEANPAQVQSFDFHKLQHLVLLKFDGKLGDTEVISGFLTTLKQQCPHLMLSVVCSAATAELYERFLPCDQVLCSPKKPNKRTLNKIIAQLKAQGPCDAVLTTEWFCRLRELYTLKKLRPSLHAGLDGKLKSLNFNLARRNPHAHVTAFFADLLKAGSLNPALPPYVLFYTEDEHLRMKACLGDKTQVIGLCPYGAAHARSLSDEAIVQICAQTEEILPQAHLLLLGLPDKIKALLQRTHLDTHERVLLPEQPLRLTELCALTSCLTALISVDTANLHLGCAAQLPVLGIFPDDRRDDPKVLWGLAYNESRPQVSYYEPGLPIESLSMEPLSQAVREFLRDLTRELSSQPEAN